MSQSYEQTRWTLTDLLPATAGPELDQILAGLESALAELEAHRDRLSPDLPAADFRRLLAVVEELGATGGRLEGYAYLWYATDTQDQDALAFLGRVQKLLTDVQNRALFFSLWWKGLEDEPAARLFAESGDNRYYLEALRNFKPHTLTEAEEKVVNLKNVNGIEGLKTLYEMITNAYTFKLEVDGEVKELTRAELSVYVRDARPELRAAAYQEMYRVYSVQSTILGQIYQYRLRDWASEYLGLRSFSSAIGVRNLANDIPNAVVDTLLEVCRANASVFQRYFRLKASWLGLPKLRRYDIYAPLQASDRTYPFGEAADMVLSALHDFSPTLEANARRVLAEQHLDSEIRPRKDSGAFCAGILPGMAPWVLVNYNGKADDVATLAHELGHAVHALMAAEHSPLTFHSSLPLAETASTFAEMLLLERLLAAETDPLARRTILARSVDDAYATVLRQAYFVLFEREAHRLVDEGQTTDALAEHYLDNLREQFGDALDLSDEFRWEWITIPHIYDRPFYCYAYTFGQLLVLSLYRQFRQEGPSFVPRYLQVLAYGGSKAPTAILTEAGIDVASPAFWQGGFDVIAEMIEELERDA